jgi:hypothetical protein
MLRIGEDDYDGDEPIQLVDRNSFTLARVQTHNMVALRQIIHARRLAIVQGILVWCIVVCSDLCFVCAWIGNSCGTVEGQRLISFGAVAPAGNLIRVRVAQPLPSTSW